MLACNRLLCPPPSMCMLTGGCLPASVPACCWNLLLQAEKLTPKQQKTANAFPRRKFALKA